MKKLFVVMGLLLIATMLFIGCGKTDNSATTQNVPPPQDYTKTGTLQGKIMDAVTGAPIGNEDNSELKMWLIQGNDNRGPSKIVNDKNDPLCGEYAFSDIPVSFDYNNNSCFMVIVVKSGYQRFEARICMGNSVTYPHDSQGPFILDTVINMIGNIYLFPEGYRAGDMKFYVYDPTGLPIPNATIGVYQNVANNNEPALNGLSYSNRLSPAGGLYSDMTTTTDANGMATISGSQLVLGGRYLAKVVPMTFNGQYLYRNISGDAFWEYSVNPPMVLTMSNLTSSSLFATSASNQVPGTITASGVLTVTFNQPIVLSTTTFTGALSATTGTVGSVTSTLDATGMVLTITPTFSAAPTGAGAYITYTYAGSAYLKNTQAPFTLTDFSNITNISTGALVSNEVQLISH